MERKYQVVCYMRIEPDFRLALSYREAEQVRDNLELMQPEHLYRIEEIDAYAGCEILKR